MKGLVLPAIKTNVELRDVPSPTANLGEVVVDLKAAALNRRDYWITRGLYPGIETPAILGSDGAGIVSSTGSDVTDWKAGDEVVIYPGTDWGDSELAQGDPFKVLGMPGNGTFAEQVSVRADQLFPRPPALTWAETAAIPVAGITAYRALLVQGGLEPGQLVLITGVGGGVGTFALQLALAQKARVFVTSSSQEKIDRAVELGASGGFLYTESNWAKDLTARHGPCDLIVDGAGGQGYGDLVNSLKPGGRLVNYGSTAGRPENLDLFKVFWRQLHLIGSSLGSPRDFRELLSFINEHEIRPVVDQTHSLADGPQAIAAMKHSQQFGKVTLEI